MKYFTLNWWNEIQGAGKVENPSEKYNDYYASIKSQLPSAFVSMVEEISLHDGIVNLIDIFPEENKLLLEIETYGLKHIHKIRLEYFGVSIFKSTANPDYSLLGGSGYGDLGYDEIELLSKGLFEHRILFSSGIVFYIRFEDIKITHEKEKYPPDEEIDIEDRVIGKTRSIGYENYLRKIKPSLPDTFIKIDDQLLLKNGRIRSLYLSLKEKRLMIEMDNCGKNGSNNIELNYYELLNLKSTRDKSVPWSASGYGQFYYNEIKILDDDVLEHRMWFDHGIEFCIYFKKLQDKAINLISDFEGEKQ